MSKEKEFDNVDNPKHYTGSCSLECIEVMEVVCGTEQVGWFCLCNTFKYLWRYKNKNGVEDVDKARWYLDWVRHQLDLGSNLSEELVKCYTRLNDLYITIQDKIANNAD